MAIAGRNNHTLLLVILHRTFIILASLECPPYCFPGRLLYPSQGSFTEGVRFNNTNGIKHPYIIGILPVAMAVLIVPILAAIVIVLLAIIAPDSALFRLW